MPTGLPSTSGVRRTLVWLLAIVYGTVVVFVAFWPTPIDRPVAGLLRRVLAELHERGVPSFIDYAFVEFSANVVFFVPVGFAIGLALPLRWFAVMFVVGPMLSAGIELTQYALLSERYATVQDVIANSAGATIGVCAALLLRALVACRDGRVIARWEASRAGDTATRSKLSLPHAGAAREEIE